MLNFEFSTKFGARTKISFKSRVTDEICAASAENKIDLLCLNRSTSYELH